jgi:hypothetical protein
MSKNAEDMALDALLAAKSEAAPELKMEIIHQAYAIEKAHQFNEVSDVRLKSLQKLVEDLVVSVGAQ